MIDAEKIVGESVKHAESLHDNTFYSLDKDGIELMGQHRLEREQESARRAVALTLRAVAGDLRNSQKDARPLASPHVQIVVKLVDGIADLYESKAAAIEKGGG